MFELVIALGGIGTLLAVGWFEKRKRQHGGDRAPSGMHPAWEAVGDELVRAVRPLDAEVQVFRDERERPGLVALIRGLDTDFRLRSTGHTTGDLEVGHLGFDQQFHLQGQTAAILARLDGPTRDALLELVRRPLRDGQLTVADGELRAVIPDGLYVSLSDPGREAVRLLAQVARRLADPIDVIAELTRSARQDPVSGVRVLCLRTLLREYPNHASVVNPLLRDLAHDADAAVRLEAAMALGPEGVAVLNALAADTSVEDEIAARAVTSLGARIDASVLRATLRREKAASALRRPATALACTAALGVHGDAQDEPLLLQLVTGERDDALRLAAVRALAQVGTAQAVPSLADLADSGSADLRRAGREAIATIQSRLRGATPGQLSLDAGGAGQVALAEDAAGRLSEPPAEDDEPGATGPDASRTR